MNMTITEIVHEMVLNGKVPAKTIAKEINKPYTTMLRELNPHDSGAKVGVDMLLPLMQASRSIAPLNHLAQQMGYALLPVVDAEAKGADPLQATMRLLQDLGELARTLETLRSGDGLRHDELDRAEQASQGVLSAAMELLEGLRSLRRNAGHADGTPMTASRAAA